MTISDMSVVTAEVKVDETDIINVRTGQDADVTIDAVPNKIFKGKVTEIGSQAVLRCSGLATTQTTTSTQEAKDFKVVVTMANPPDNVRPGLSTTAKIRTAERKNVLAVPIQALAVRTRKDLEEAAKLAKKNSGDGVTLAAPPPPPAGTDPKKDEIQGLFIVRGKKALIHPGRNRHQRRHRHRSEIRLEVRRRNRHRQLQGAAHPEARGLRQGGQHSAQEDGRPAELTRPAGSRPVPGEFFTAVILRAPTGSGPAGSQHVLVSAT